MLEDATSESGSYLLREGTRNRGISLYAKHFLSHYHILIRNYSNYLKSVVEIKCQQLQVRIISYVVAVAVGRLVQLRVTVAVAGWHVVAVLQVTAGRCCSSSY